MSKDNMTAVEWIYRRYHKMGLTFFDLTDAINMEKNQIKEAYEAGVRHNDVVGPEGLKFLSEEYYKDNYGE